MKVLITGGTGTIGKLLTEKLIKYGHKVTIYSRDEYKQAKLALPCEKIIGCVRDFHSLSLSIKKHDIVLHTAALKHVDIGEHHQDEFVKTNYYGTLNAVMACKYHDKKLVMLSTDKACYPINVYGMTKALAEKKVLSEGQTVIRYGNVLDSRGSIIERFADNMLNGESVPVTDKSMTRFWTTQEHVAEYICGHVVDGLPGLYIPKMKSATLWDLLTTVSVLMGKEIKTHDIAIRAGEKLHECLFTKYEKVQNAKEWDYRKEVHSNDIDARFALTDLEHVLRYQLKVSRYI